MKPSSWDQQLGLASPRESAASQSDQTNHPSNTTVLERRRSSTKRTTVELSEQHPCDGLSKRSNGPGVMPLRAHRANPEDGIGKALRGRVSPLYRRERRGGNGSVRPPGTHTPQYRESRDGETRASLVLRSGPGRVLASVPRNHAR